MENRTIQFDIGGGGYTVSQGGGQGSGGYVLSGPGGQGSGGFVVPQGQGSSSYTVTQSSGYVLTQGEGQGGGGYNVIPGGGQGSAGYIVSGPGGQGGGGYVVTPGQGSGGYTVTGPGGQGVGGYTVTQSTSYVVSGAGSQGSSGYVVSGGGAGVEGPGMQGTALTCFNCSLNLTGYRYILRDEKPFCIRCYEAKFAHQCEDCKRPIGTDHKDLSYKDKHWHESCFKCFDCKASLVDRSFAYKNDKTYCADCHDNNFALRCDGCNNIFRAGMKKFEFKGKQYHEQCFSCKVCRQPIGTKTFIPRDQEVVCVPCYEEQYAQRCVKCNGVINKGGITYKNTPWHRECFTCYGCNRMLTGEKFTSREEKPFCSDCFAQFFAKKCCRCVRPITGLGTTKFISFDDRHWHTDCFLCYKCSTSLVGRGFLVTGQDVLCPECGRA